MDDSAFGSARRRLPGVKALDRVLGTLPGHGIASVHRDFRGPLVFAPAQLIGAVPVSPPDALDRISGMVDAVICLELPVDFRAIGQL